MKHRIHLAMLALSLGAGLPVVTAPAQSHPNHDHKTPDQQSASGESNALDVEKARADYPLDSCVVSGDKLESGDMGDPIDYVHKEAGKPDRLVRLCCKSCVRDFKKDPQKYLKAIDDAAAGKPHASGSGGHHH